MIQAVIVISLLAVLVVTIKLVTKSLYREKKPSHTIRPQRHMQAKNATHAVRTTAQ